MMMLQCPWCSRIQEYQDDHDKHVLSCSKRPFHDWDALEVMSRTQPIPCDHDVGPESP